MSVKVAAGGPGSGGSASRPGSSTFACWLIGRNNWGVRQTWQPRVPVQGNKASKPLTEKTCLGCGGRRNSQPHRRVCWRDPQGPRMYAKPPTWDSAPEWPHLLVSSGGSVWKLTESWASDIVPSWTSPSHTVSCGLPHPGKYLRLCPLLCNKHAKTKKKKKWPTWKNSSKLQKKYN